LPPNARERLASRGSRHDDWNSGEPIPGETAEQRVAEEQARLQFGGTGVPGDAVGGLCCTAPGLSVTIRYGWSIRLPACFPWVGLRCQIPAISYIEHCQIGGSWIRVGPQVESWIGYTAEQSYVPNFWKSCLHPEDKDRVLAEDERCEQTLEPWHHTYRLIARDGHTMWVRDEAVVVYDDRGEPRHWQGISFDITDRTMAQDETTRRLAALDEQKDSLLTAAEGHRSRSPCPAPATSARSEHPSFQPPDPDLLVVCNPSACRLVLDAGVASQGNSGSRHAALLPSMCRAVLASKRRGGAVSTGPIVHDRLGGQPMHAGLTVAGAPAPPGG
jgi:PAS domain S-box-containing protein